MTELFNRRGTLQRAPTNAIDYQYSMKMIRHDNKCIDPDTRSYLSPCEPFGPDDFSDRVQSHNSIRNFAQQAILIVNAQSDEIRAHLRIIVSRQTDRPPVMFVWIKPHHNSPAMTPPEGAATPQGHVETGP